MNPVEVKAAIQQAATNLKNSMAGYRVRRGQLEMMAGVTNTILDAYVDEESKGLVAEAPCGTGKTIGYGLPAIVAAKEIGLNVVISTATVALQEQLISKDLPELSAASGVSFNYKLLKGRGRYACPSRIHDFSSSSSQSSLFSDSASHLGQVEDGLKEYAEKLDEALRDHNWDGDFDSAPMPLTEQTKKELSVTGAACSGSRCRFYNHCPFYKARQTDSVDVFVVNHDLLLSSIIANSDAIPDLSDCILIIDEAHALPEKAVSHFASSMHVSSDVKWAREYFDKFCTAASSLGKGPAIEAFQQRIESLIFVESELHKIVYEDVGVKDDLAKLKRFRRSGEWVYNRYSNGEIPDDVKLLCEEGIGAASGAISAIASLSEAVGKAVKDGLLDQMDAERAVAELGSMSFYFEQQLGVFEGLSATNVDNTAPWAKWFQVREKNDGGLEVVYSASPITNGSMLRNKVFNQSVAYILTSATITTLGNFDSFLHESGLTNNERVQTLSLQSPFDFQQKALLEVPKMANQPNDFDGYSAEAAGVLNLALKETMGSLVLFCSYRQMRHVFDLLTDDIKAVTQMQGEESRAVMLAEHAQRIKEGKPSCLFGVSSLAEGLDLRRELCSQVVIVKLPFAPPDNPVDEAKSEWIEKNGGNAFMQLAVPAASLKLNQAAGRLLRTEDDFGRILLLDDRLISKRYGPMLIDGLPPFARKMGLNFEPLSGLKAAVS